MKMRGIIPLVRTYFYKIIYHITVGKRTRFLGKCEIESRNDICFGEKCVISPWVVLKDWGGYIHLGNNCSINSFCYLSGNGGIEIGNNVRIATQSVIVSANHKFDRTDIPIIEQGETRECITIEDDVWIGAGVKILAGVTIGRGSVIGAGAVVTNDIPEFSVCVGVPARIIKKRMSDSFLEQV